MPLDKEAIDEALNTERICLFFDSVDEYIGDEPDRLELSESDCLEVAIVVEGSGVHCFEDKFIPCKIGDIYIVPPSTSHGYYLTEPSGQLVIRKLLFRVCDWLRGDAAQSDNKRFCYGVFQDGGSVAYAMLNRRMRETVASAMNGIECELADKEEDRRTVIYTYIVQMLCYLSRYINRSLKNSQRRSKEWDLTAEVMRLIDENFEDNSLSLEAIAAQLFVSPSNLSRIFKAQSGRLFSEHLRDVRLNRAVKLLEETSYTVERIASECGIRDISSFYRNFRKTFGMSPQIYKQIKQTKNNSIGREYKMELLKEISLNVQSGKAKATKELVQRAIDEGANVEEILNEGLLAGMSVIGEKFKNNEVFVPEVLVAARAMNMGAQLLKPLLDERGVQASGRVCIGTVQGDLHDIGKNLVKMMMESRGLEVIDLGTDVSPEAFVKTAIEENCNVICCSALLTTTMPSMGEVVKAASEAGIRDKVKIMIGGAPISSEFCRQIGADCYTADAASAAEAAAKFCTDCK